MQSYASNSQESSVAHLEGRRLVALKPEDTEPLSRRQLAEHHAAALADTLTARDVEQSQRGPPRRRTPRPARSDHGGGGVGNVAAV